MEKINISPIHKKDDKTDVANYRSISLKSSVGKALEKLVHKHVHNFVLENNIITPFQSDFTPGGSTVNQLVDWYNFVMPSRKVRKSVWYFATLVKPSTRYGIAVF